MRIKTSVSLDDKLVAKADETAKEMGINRSRFIEIALEHEFNMLDAEKSVSVLSSINADEVFKMCNKFASIVSEMQEATKEMEV